MYIHGILLGFSLSLLIGPMLFAIISASLERGFRAGVSVASGIWASDLMFLYFIYHSIGMLSKMVAHPQFKLYASLAGGAVLLVLGSINLVGRRVPEPTGESAADRLLDTLDGPEQEGVDNNWKRWGYIGYWLRGFLLNTVNPFTVFFWLGFASTIIIPNQWTQKQTLIFFTGMLSTLVLIDILKAYLAKRLRDFLTPRHILRVQRVIGILLLCFGVVLVIQAL